ncbi:hypothetical protein ACFQYP_65390 [Nonomuraea antimicrobica]
MTALALAFPLAATGCTASYDTRMTYLRTTAQRGVDTHKLLYSQEARIDKARCERAYDGSGVVDEAPHVETIDGREAWHAQVKEFFVDSCLSGKPKPVPADLPHPGDSPQASTTAAPTSSPTKSAATATPTTTP